VVKSLDTFEFLSIPSVNKALVLELARCEFLLRRENVLLLGNSGTAKRIWRWRSVWPPARGAIACASRRPRHWCTN